MGSMAAITFKFGVQSQITPEESRLASEKDTLRGLGDASAIDAAVLSQTHAALWNMTYLRSACAQILEGRTISVEFKGRNVWLVLDRPLPQEPAWNPPTQDGLRRFKLLSWTTKMGTPSFSLPAGAPSMGGSCVGASGGQTLVPLTTRRKQMETVAAITGHAVSPARAICQHCYAEGGQYSTGQVQYAQLIRFAWVQQAVRDGTFAQVMSWAVKNADYRLDGKGKVEDEDDNGDKIFVPARGERDGKKYFRIHDSGDFFSLDYVAAWRAVADDNPDVTFWAPTRIWAVGQKVIDQVNAINAPLRNLILRPSAYQINAAQRISFGPGWAAGTTVFGEKRVPQDFNGDVIEPNPAFDWDCKAYQTDTDKVTCRDAKAPDGQVGCRACWKYGDRGGLGGRGLVVNYTLH